ncbi:MAG: 23S rRNA (adenine(2503)-C(2))-methyltransferase RlmN, partial [Acidobacteriota bacterium]|nr:23S rRNA (adenine(2503)-C(2))-methyltransferase RlmN [Acidobacteriota bacterium]
FEYVMLSGINDGADDARRLGNLLRDLPAKVNLIPWNSLPMLPYRRPSVESVERFRVAARETGLDVLVRYSRGADIAAACGQLHTSEVALPSDTLS